MYSDAELKEMFAQYVATALWSTLRDDPSSDNGECLDSEYGPDDVDAETLETMEADCCSFAKANAADLDGMDPGQAGHDFWLTRQGHGAGFWDRGLGARGDRLSKAASALGEFDLYEIDGEVCH